MMHKMELGTPIKFWCEECNEELYNIEDPGFCSDMFCNPNGDPSIWFPEVRGGMCAQSEDDLESGDEPHTWYMIAVETQP